MDIEKGDEVYMSRELRQDRLPSSFRFYDQTFNMIQKRISFDRREFYGLKKAIALHFYEISAQNSVKTKLGLANTDDKLKFQHSAVNKRSRKEINHYLSPHCLDLQRSNYMCIDNDIANYNKIEVHQNGATAQTEKGGVDKETIVNTLNVKYCKAKEVNQNRQKFLNFKATYAAKQDHLKIMGQRTEILSKVDNWLDQKIDNFYPCYTEFYHNNVKGGIK